MLKVETVEENPDRNEFEEAQQIAKQHKTTRKIKRNLNKEGLNSENVIHDVNEKALRKHRQTKGIDLSFYI